VWWVIEGEIARKSAFIQGIRGLVDVHLGFDHALRDRVADDREE